MSSENLTLDEFPIPSAADWRKEAEALLDGVPFEKKLVSKTYEGIDLQPIYNQEDIQGLAHLGSLPGNTPYVRGTRSDATVWEVAQEIPYGFPKEFNQAAREDLQRGQTALKITLDVATRRGIDPDQAAPGESGLCALSLSTKEDLERALDGINLERTPLFLEAGSAPVSLFALLLAYLKGKGLSASVLRGAFEQDPVGDLLIDGLLPQSLKTTFNQMATITKWGLRECPQFQTVAVRAHAYQDGGGNAVQELAFALATGVEYLRQLEARGLKIDQIAPRIRFSFAVGGDFFMAIAKFRAARMLWAQIVAASGGNEHSQKMRIHARTSLWNKSQLDPYVNMLRGTTEAFAAVAAGCDSLAVGAFDEVVRPPDEFSRRIARNTQIILRDECRFGHVVDPAGGSYFVEKLTDQLARKSWELFQQVEKQGGMLKALEAGFPQAEVAAVAAKRAEAIAQRRNSLVGVNVYANPTEQPLKTEDLGFSDKQKKRAQYVAEYRTSAQHVAQMSVLSKLSEMLESRPEQVLILASEAAELGATLGEITRTLRASDSGERAAVKPIPVSRGAEPFEKLRAAVSAAGLKVFLANMGPLRQYKARADFSTSFFQAGSFQVLDNRGFAGVEQAAQAALASDAQVVVICSTDDTYPELVPPLVQAIKAGDSKRIVVLAGYPKDHVEAFSQAGVDEFIHIRANCLELLSRVAGKLGVSL